MLLWHAGTRTLLPVAAPWASVQSRTLIHHPTRMRVESRVTASSMVQDSRIPSGGGRNSLWPGSLVMFADLFEALRLRPAACHVSNTRTKTTSMSSQPSLTYWTRPNPTPAGLHSSASKYWTEPAIPDGCLHRLKHPPPE
ncbi:hypothetical protein S40288_10723 [Stachybotrys chartarum IBT 40288]|nr:hypothetical protein S40288_10723 [Stachybotrys chartarum IBT 40288]